MGAPLPCDQLRWTCDPARFSFETTADVDPIAGVVGQPSALEALRFGIECDAPGQNVFVRGLRGTGRMSMIKRLLDELQPSCPVKSDRCYVHNFRQPDRPRLITLPAGRAQGFRRQLRMFADFVANGLPEALNGESFRARRKELQEQIQAEASALSTPLEEELREAGLALVSMQSQESTQTAIFPLHEGQPIPPDQLRMLVQQGTVSEEVLTRFEEQAESFQERLESVTEQVSEILQKGSQRGQQLVEGTARRFLRDAVRDIREDHPNPAVERFLDEAIDDVVELLGSNSEGVDPYRRYGVNLVVENGADQECPIVVEDNPTVLNLLGTIEPEMVPGGMRNDYTRIHSGSLLRADGGYLILDANDVFTESGAWKVLIRTLRSGRLEMTPPELGGSSRSPVLKPEPIPIGVRVILVGDAEVYHALDASDPDFQDLFKVLADFDHVIARDDEGLRQYAGVLSRIAREEDLLPFDRTAVAALVEHGSRIASRNGKLTARFGRLADLAREASFLAKREGANRVNSEQVNAAVRRSKERGNLPSRRFQEFLADGTITVETRGEVVGQINGMAVINAGPLTYGFPARITATIGAGSAGVIDIESRAAMSGAIHTKGFHILGGLLRHLLRTSHPLAFSASVTFEQSYGGIDGDSASGAEMCCLLSALTGLPIRQSFAMTGAIDQHGRIQSIGGVNEKVEGFYDTCAAAGLTGEQGAIIPQSNAGDLMLREDVVAACAAGKFQVHAVDSVHEALEILTGVPAGECDADGEYPEGSVLARALEQAHEYWRRTVQTPIPPRADQARRETEE